MAFRRSVSKPCRCLLLVAVCFVATSCFAWTPGATSPRGLHSCVPRCGKAKRQKGVEQDNGLLAKQKALRGQIFGCKSADEVLQVAEGSDLSLNFFGSIVLWACINKMAKLRKTVKRPLSASTLFCNIVELYRQAVQRRQVVAKEAANTLWAIAITKDKIPEFQELLSAVIEVLDQKMLDAMNCQEAVNTLWALAMLNTYKPNVRSSLDLERLPDMLVERIISTNIQRANIQDLNNALWSVTRLPPSIASLEEQLLPALLSRCREYLAGKDLEVDERYSPNGIARIVWSLSLLNYKDTIIIDQVSEIFLKTASNPDPRHINAFIDVVCAHAKLQVVDEPLLEATTTLPWKLFKLRDWDLCALAWSYQELDPTEKHKSFQSKLRKEVTRRKLTQAQVAQSQHGYEEWYSER